MTVKVKCVHCGTMVHEFTATCPNCGKPVANKDAPVNVAPPPWQKKHADYSKKSPVIPMMIIAVIVACAAVYFFLK
ncbi:MAG TPA: hypothetical protein PK986_07365 [Spirochaetota bacterium]|nr:hypothetical protein [Spirochaetota bacterium]HQO40270.1 hypothetical protein [Spirochaetota bacterium]